MYTTDRSKSILEVHEILGGWTDTTRIHFTALNPSVNATVILKTTYKQLLNLEASLTRRVVRLINLFSIQLIYIMLYDVSSPVSLVHDCKKFMNV